jgi:GH18 family chitinase
VRVFIKILSFLSKFTNWGSHRALSESRLYPEDIPADLCTHILYAFASINGGVLSNTIENDISNFYGQKVLIKSI